MKIATKAAWYSNVHSAKVSAIAFQKNGQIITHAHNRGIYGHKRYFTEHAEENLIRKLHKLKAFDRFDDICILVIRVNTFGVMIAKPCTRCQKKLNELDVDVFYSNRHGEIEELYL